MRECPSADVRDLLPDFVHGRLDEAAHLVVATHVAGCADCGAEAELIRRAIAVATLATPQVDVARIAAAIPASLPAAALAARVPGLSRRLGGRTLTQIAAAVMVAVIGVGVLQFLGRHGGDPDIAALSHPEATVTAGDPGVAGRAIAAPVRPGERAPTNGAGAPQRTSLALVGGIEALTNDQLAVLVTAVDALDPLFAVEPGPYLPGMEEVW